MPFVFRQVQLEWKVLNHWYQNIGFCCLEAKRPPSEGAWPTLPPSTFKKVVDEEKANLLYVGIYIHKITLYGVSKNRSNIMRYYLAVI